MSSGWDNLLQAVTLFGLGVGCAVGGCRCQDTHAQAALLGLGTTLVGAAVRHLKDTPDPPDPAQPGNKNQ